MEYNKPSEKYYCPILLRHMTLEEARSCSENKEDNKCLETKDLCAVIRAQIFSQQLQES